MSEYKRIISYIYKYADGERKADAGYVKIQTRSGQWRMTVRLQGNYAPGQVPYKIFLYTTDDVGLKGTCLGELQSQGGVLEWNGFFREEEAQVLLLNQAQGIWIGSADAVKYASDWAGNPVEGKRLLVVDPQHPGELLEAGQGAEDAAPEEEESQEPTPPEPERMQEPTSPEPERIQESEEPPKSTFPEPEEHQEQQVKCMESRQAKWEYLTSHFHVQKLFLKNGSAMDCIRIGPRDLQRLPRGSWILGNNSFLLHGYYQYRHLLLCRQECNGEMMYFLGVPGIYNEKEVMMAELFGFSDFRRSGNPRNQQGDFGYWFRKIEEA